MTQRAAGVRRRPPAAADESTRDRVIDAAVACILEEGFYRASSNRIASRAGVTWGVIQHHFGTREQLLLAVVRQSADELLQALTAAEIHGATVGERLESLADVIWSYYRRPAFLAHVQILLNLGRDPRTSAQTVEALAELERRVGGLWQGLVDQVVEGAQQPPGIGIAIFDIVRGVAIGEAMIEAVPSHAQRSRSSRQPGRETLLRALTLLLEQSSSG
jgi:AcrR family transcriptional regulator